MGSGYSDPGRKKDNCIEKRDLDRVEGSNAHRGSREPNLRCGGEAAMEKSSKEREEKKNFWSNK